MTLWKHFRHPLPSLQRSWSDGISQARMCIVPLQLSGVSWSWGVMTLRTAH
jgi:hypothetical protein